MFFIFFLPKVQNRIASYFADLIGIGFSGFRVDAAKHIKPDDLADIFTLFREKMGGSLPDDFVTWLEVSHISCSKHKN